MSHKIFFAGLILYSLSVTVSFITPSYKYKTKPYLSSPHKPYVRIPLEYSGSVKRRFPSPSSKSKLNAIISWPNIDLIQTSKLWSKLDASVFAKYLQRLTVLAAGVFIGIKAKIKKSSVAMEAGWQQRGVGGSFARTIEVWVFAIGFAIRYVRSASTRITNLHC